MLAKVVDQVVAGLGSLDILVNNAGIIRRAPVLEFSEKDWDDVLQINLKAVFLLSQAAGRVMVAQGRGKIINIASMLSFQGGIRVPSYTASKSGVAGITRLMANELAAKGSMSTRSPPAIWRPTTPPPCAPTPTAPRPSSIASPPGAGANPPT